MLSVEVRVFLMIGILGAFTTYSTFGNETFELMRESSYLLVLINVGAHIVLGFSAVWLGRIIGFAISEGLVTIEKANIIFYRSSNSNPENCMKSFQELVKKNIQF